MRHLLTLGTILFLLVLTGCDKKDDNVSPSSPSKKLESDSFQSVPFLKDSLTPNLTEASTDALVVWRKYRQLKPTLVVLSNNPPLLPVPEQLQEDARSLLNSTSTQELKQAVSLTSTNPTLLPQMALNAALDADFFSRVVWVLPVRSTAESFSWETVKQKLVTEGFPNASSFSASEFGLSGSVHGTTFDIAHAETLPSQLSPIVVHLDMSYFAPIYKGEIKTPIYPLLYKTLAKIRSADWKALAATVCPGNAEGRLPLETRFVAHDLMAICQRPELLGEPLPQKWQQRAQALYLENFMQTDKIIEIYSALTEAHPENASFRFGFYQALRQRKKGDQALKQLDKAVQLDKLYGIEYMNLAPTALEKNTPRAAFDMLNKALQTFPKNPFIKLELAQSYLLFDQGDHALPLLKELRSLNWSTTYYPDVPDVLRELTSKADSISGQPSSG